MTSHSFLTRARVLGTAGLLTLAASGVLAGGAVASAAETVEICHASDANENPYIRHTPARSGDVSGHGDHTGPLWNDTLKDQKIAWGDIIPPFDYAGGHYPGLNWTAVGQAWWTNDCAEPPALTVTVDKTNDADGDATFTDDETADAAGADVDFSVVVTNDSDVAVVVDSLTDAVGADPVAVTCDDAVVGETVAAGDSLTCTFSAAGYSPADGASKTNTATVTVHQAGNALNTGSGSDTSVVSTDVPVVPEEADLSIVKEGPDAVAPGDDLTWTVTVSNNGGSEATDVVVTDALPDGVTYASAAGTGWTCTGTASLSCALDAPLPAGGDSEPLTVVGALSDDYADDTVSNTAVVGPTDATPEDNTATAVTDVTEEANGGGGTENPPTPISGGEENEFTGGSGELAFTGAPIRLVATIALAMLALGSALVAAGRRRSTVG